MTADKYLLVLTRSCEYLDNVWRHGLVGRLRTMTREFRKSNVRLRTRRRLGAFGLSPEYGGFDQNVDGRLGIWRRPSYWARFGIDIVAP